MVRFCSTSRCCPSGFAKLMARNVQKSEAFTLLWERFEVSLDENLDGLFAGVNLDPNGRIAKVNLVSSSARSSNDGVGHDCLA